MNSMNLGGMGRGKGGGTSKAYLGGLNVSLPC